MTLPLRPSALTAVAVAAIALGGLPSADRGASVAGAYAADADLAALRAALERVFAAAEADHAKVRAKDFGTRLAGFPAELRAAIVGEAAEAGKDAGRVLVRIPEEVRPISAGSLRVVIARMLAPRPADPVPADEFDERACLEGFLAAVADVFSAERFEDCWDRSFQDLPEVVAWREAHAKAAAPPPADPPPGPPEPPGDPAGPRPETPPGPDVRPSAPREAPRAPALPTPFALDPVVNLVPLDRVHGWVGPWTGWTQEIPEKENRRQKRPAKTVWIDRYEVTCFDYLRFLRAEDEPRRRALLPAGWSLDAKGEPSCPAGRERSPVTGVTFLQAQVYAERLGKRLPTEDEWDRAAGGGDRDVRPFPWGASAEGRRWAYAGGGADGPAGVDEYPDDRTPDGVVGLAGNVAEMVASLPDRRDVPARVPATLQIVVRGGSYRTSRETDCGTSFRWVLEAGQSAPHVGFRCVTDEAEYRRRFR